MPNRDPLPQPDANTPRGPSVTPGIPDREQESSPTPPVIAPTSDTKNPNDPTLIPVGDPAGMA